MSHSRGAPQVRPWIFTFRDVHPARKPFRPYPDCSDVSLKGATTQGSGSRATITVFASARSSSRPWCFSSRYFQLVSRSRLLPGLPPAYGVFCAAVVALVVSPFGIRITAPSIVLVATVSSIVARSGHSRPDSSNIAGRCRSESALAEPFKSFRAQSLWVSPPASQSLLSRNSFLILLVPVHKSRPTEQVRDPEWC